MGKGVGIGKRQRGIRKSDLSYAFLFRPPSFCQSGLGAECLENRLRGQAILPVAVLLAIAG